MDRKTIVSPRANGKSVLQQAKTWGAILSVVWGISEEKGFKIALEAYLDSKEEDEDE